MNPSLTLPTTPLEHPAMDYAFLRSEGIHLLERLAGQRWTDFNLHDPGITILEQLCYAISDLGYRINYDIKDLLTSGSDDAYRSLYSPAKVLTTKPITLNDVRKLVIDVPGVKNAWIEPVENSFPGLVYDASESSLYLTTASTTQPPHREPLPLRGLYRILVETDEGLHFHSNDILPEVNRRLHACRGLAEDFLPPSIPPREAIIVNAVIEIGAVEDPERLLAQVYHALASFISPRIHFYTLTEMLDQGKNIDEILDGPPLQHGFVDDADLERFERKAGLRTSDLLQEVMNIQGVTAVSGIRISSGGKPEDWYLKLTSGSTPFLDVARSLSPDENGKTVIQLTRRGISVHLKPSRVKEIIDELQKTSDEKILPEEERDILLAPGKDRKVGQYHSIQHQFPAVYGLGALGLPESASPERQAQSKQLKAYLMFFDQLLANYFSQLENAKELFSFYSEQPRTYFSQTINDPSLGLDEIMVHDQAGYATKVQEITEDPKLAPDNSSSPWRRKNRFLNHLLARFAEQFTDYSLLQYTQLQLAKGDLIKDKCAFLQDYGEIGAARGVGFNYTLPSWGHTNVSGLAKRITRKLGISSYRQQDLAALDAKKDEGGFHILEHILLRPRPADTDQSSQATGGIGGQPTFMAQPNKKDPYSHQLSFIFPNWVERFDYDNKQGFRELIEKTLREETPAHIRVYIHWLNQKDMLAFETAQKDWLEMVIAGRLWTSAHIKSDDLPERLTHLKLRDARDRMVQILGIGFPYPLRDVILKYPDTVSYKYDANIEIRGGQAGVNYQLCDEDGNPIVEKVTVDGKQVEKTFEVRPQPGENPILLKTPAILKDITFTILASRETTNQNRLETYLNETVPIKVGIDTKVEVAFQLSQSQVIVASYGDKVTVVVRKSQEGISYQLVTVLEDNKFDELSSAEKGNKDDILLTSTSGFNEDTPIKVLAFRTAAKNTKALLDANLMVLVRPNPAVAVNISTSLLDYKAATQLTIATPQPKVEYRLFKRDAAPAEYLPDGTAGAHIVQTDEGRRIAVKVPDTVTDWNAPAGFVLVDTFKDSSGSLSVDTGSLLEDTLFIVQATKVENREQLQLDQSFAVLVRPNPDCPVSVVKAEVIAETSGMVQVKDTQKGVRYQLRLDADNSPINPPGYHQTDRALETVRVQVDLAVESQAQAEVLLPTSPITQATAFNVLAIKNITGVSAQLSNKATVKVDINTAVQAVFQPSQSQVLRKAQIVASYGDKVTVVVRKSEEGASYELVSGPKDSLVKLSTAKAGNKDDILLTSTAGFNEDTPIKVRVFRTAEKSVWALLDANLTVLVRPNPAVTISVDAPIIDYGATSTLWLVNHQASVEYHLYKRELVPSDYLSSPAKGDLVIEVDKDRQIAIKAPQKVTTWDDSSGFVLVDKFSASAGSSPVSTGDLLEDTLFIVQATKIENGEQLQLDQAVVLLVRPNPACAVSVAKAEVASGEQGLVRVNGTQKGVHYQLRLDIDNTPANPPGYHQTDRALETVRVEVDLAVESQGPAVLLLPTPAISAATTFNVLAIKTITSISAPLNKKATVDVSAT